VLGRHHAAITQRDREIQNCKLVHYEADRRIGADFTGSNEGGREEAQHARFVRTKFT
jgi:hypothetical protein